MIPMNWLALLKLVLTVADKLFGHIERNQLMKAGEARAIVKQMESLNARVQKAAQARDDVRRDSDAGGLRDDDGYRRD